MSVVERISELCKKRGVSLNVLEKETGLGKSTIYRWDESSPAAEKLQKVADYFGVSTDYLLGREIEENDTQNSDYGSVMEQLEMLHKNPKLRVLLSSGSKLDSKGIEAVINIIDQMNKE